MNAIFRVLNGGERRTVGRLALAAVLAAVLGFVLAARQRSGWLEASGSLVRTQEELLKAEDSLAQAKAEWLRWQQARRDLVSLEESYFYDGKTCVTALMQDLQVIFRQAGASVSQIGYSYDNIARGRYGRVVVDFNYSGTYGSFKKFLSTVERFPKFLAVEKIDFQNVGSSGGPLSLRITMAGYYAL